MQQTNYCRQMIVQFKAMAAVPSVEPEKKAVVEHVIDLCRASQKFMLPTNGILLPDAEFRALDDSVPLRLPHPFVALEFAGHGVAADGGVLRYKRVAFCREDEDGIYVRPAAYFSANGFWMVKRDARIPRVNYLNRSNPSEVVVVCDYQGTEDRLLTFNYIVVVLGFLNALACSNVRVQAISPKKTGKKIKGALPFDTYHVLTIDTPSHSGEGAATGGHRSPREHLRRGHIRRLPDGRRIWVNATVVAAGRGAGVVTKDYLLRSAAVAPQQQTH